MPFVKRSVEPTHIRKDILRASQATLGGEHEALVNGSLVHVLRQIADLTAFVNSLFQELVEESSSLLNRSVKLKTRTCALSEKVKAMNVLETPLPESSLQLSASCGRRRFEHVARLHEREQQCCLFTPTTRPACVRTLYGAAASAALPTDATAVSLTPVLCCAGPTRVEYYAGQKAHPYEIVHPTEALKRPRWSASMAQQKLSPAAVSNSLLSPSAFIAVSTSRNTFEQISTGRQSLRSGHQRLARRLTLSGVPTELTNLRSSGADSSLNLARSSSRLDLRLSVQVISKDPDAYVVDDSSKAAEGHGRSRRRRSLLDRLLRRSHSLPRNFERYHSAFETVQPKVDGAVVCALVDDRAQKVYTNFYGEPNSALPDTANLTNPGLETLGDGDAKSMKSQRALTRNRSRSHADLPVGVTASATRSRPPPRASSAERTRCEHASENRHSGGDTLLSQTLSCLFRRNARPRGDETSSCSLAASSLLGASTCLGECRSTSEQHALAATPKPTVLSRSRRASQLLAYVTLRKRDSKVTTSSSSGRWSGSERQSFGSDGNFSSGSHHRLSRLSVDRDSAVYVDMDRPCESSFNSAALAASANHDGYSSIARRGYAGDEPLFVQHVDDEVLSIYSVDQDGFYTTMHTDSCLQQATDGDDTLLLGRGPISASSENIVELCDGAVQTDLTFGIATEDDPPGKAEDTFARAIRGFSVQTGPDCLDTNGTKDTGHNIDGKASDEDADCLRERTSTKVPEAYHSLVAVTPACSDDEDESLAPHDVFCAPPLPQPLCGLPNMPLTEVHHLSPATTSLGPGQQSCSSTNYLDDEQSSALQAGSSKAVSPCGGSIVLNVTALPLAMEHAAVAVNLLSTSHAVSRFETSSSPAVSHSETTSSLINWTDKGSPSAVEPLPQALTHAKPYRSLPRSFSSARNCSMLSPAVPDRHTDEEKEEDLPASLQTVFSQTSGLASVPSDAVEGITFPQMAADAEALNVATAKCLSVLATHFKVKAATQSTVPTTLHALSPLASSSGCKSKALSAGAQVSSLIQQARRLSACGANETTTAGHLQEGSDTFVCGDTSCLGLWGHDNQRRFSIQTSSLPSSLEQEAMEACNEIAQPYPALPQRARYIPLSEPHGRRGETACSFSRPLPSTELNCFSGASKYASRTTILTCDGNSHNRTVSYRIANGGHTPEPASASLRDSDSVQLCGQPRADGLTSSRRSSRRLRQPNVPNVCTAPVAPPPRTLSYRVANEEQQRCSVLLSDGSGSAAYTGVLRPNGPANRMSVREFMKGVYENDQRHLSAPAAPSGSELVPIAKRIGQSGTNSRVDNGGSGRPSTFLPESGTACLGSVPEGSSCDFAEAIVPEKLCSEFAAPRRQTLVTRERPRSAVMTKGDKKDLEWVHNNFAALLQRCFQDDSTYTSLEALRQDESTLLSLIDSVQGHTVPLVSAATALPPVSPATASAFGQPCVHTEV